MQIAIYPRLCLQFRANDRNTTYAEEDSILGDLFECLRVVQLTKEEEMSRKRSHLFWPRWHLNNAIILRLWASRIFYTGKLILSFLSWSSDHSPLISSLPVKKWWSTNFHSGLCSHLRANDHTETYLIKTSFWLIWGRNLRTVVRLTRKVHGLLFITSRWPVQLAIRDCAHI